MKNILKKLQFWKAKKMKQEYDLIPIEDADMYAIKLKGGKYDGIMYCYGSVSVDESIPKLNFDYTIIDTNKFFLDHLTNDEEFHTMIGDILVEMITAEGQDDTPRNNNPEESNPL